MAMGVASLGLAADRGDGGLSWFDVDMKGSIDDEEFSFFLSFFFFFFFFFSPHCRHSRIV